MVLLYVQVVQKALECLNNSMKNKFGLHVLVYVFILCDSELHGKLSENDSITKNEIKTLNKTSSEL